MILVQKKKTSDNQYVKLETPSITSDNHLILLALFSNCNYSCDAYFVWKKLYSIFMLLFLQKEREAYEITMEDGKVGVQAKCDASICNTK